MDGFLVLNKPRGPTSFAMVGLVRRITGIRRVGHGGTLDPAASGVLPICIGQATRMAEYLLQGTKEYRAVVHLGVSTDSYDAEGKVTTKRDASQVKRRDVERLLPRFTGPIGQVPPMHSALKRDGRRLYDLAREGIEVERGPRDVIIERLALTQWDPPFLTLDVECGHGTYIRSLAHDLGEGLGCGAHLAALTRTRVGPFHLSEAVTPEALSADGPFWETHLYPLDHLVLPTRAAVLDEAAGRAVCDGRPCRQDRALETAPWPGEPCRAYSHDGRLLAMLAYDATESSWKPEKVFVSPGDT
jgi:tRNA pseudouridine55 synthase